MKKNKLALLLIVFMAFNLVITSVPSLTMAEDTLFNNSEEGKVAIKDDSGQTPIPEEGPEVPGLPGEETPNLENSVIDDPNPADPDLNNPDLPDQNIDEESPENESDPEAPQVNPEDPEGLLSNQDEQEPNVSENAEQENSDAMEENGNSEEGGIAENLEFEISEELEIERLGVPNTQSTVPEDWSAIFLDSYGVPIFPAEVTKEDAQALLSASEADRPELLLEFNDDPVTLKKSNNIGDSVDNVQAVILRTAKAYWNLNNANIDPVFQSQNVTLTVLKNISLQSNGGVIPLDFTNVVLQSLPGNGNQFVIENGYDSDSYSDTRDVIHIHYSAGNVLIKNLIIDGKYLGPGITFDNLPENTTTKIHLILDGNVTVRNCGETGVQSGSGSNGIWMSAGTSLTMRNAGNKIENCISPNTSTKGSAIFVNAGCTVSIDGASFENNQSQNQGGAIHSANLDSIVTLKKAVFTNNSATNNGGAIIVNGNLTVEECTFTGNHTIKKGGGAIFCGKPTTSADISYSKFISNESGTAGGAIYQSDGTLKCHNNEFISNIAKTNGGAIGSYSEENNLDEEKLQIANNKFQNNAANKGGAIYLYKLLTTAKINASTFIDNKAALEGGAIFVNPYQYESPISDADAYKNLTTDAQTTFKGNSAGAGLFAPPINFDEFVNLEFSDDSDVTHGILTRRSLLNNYDVNYKRPGVEIIFDANVGAFADGDLVKTVLPEGEEITMLYAPARDGYTFAGWSDGTATYQPNDSYTVVGDKTFLAQWKPI